MISPLAYVHPDAHIDPTADIGPLAYIEDNVEIGAGTRIMANASVMHGSRIGRDCTVFPSAVVGAIPQDLKFRGEETLAIIGDRTVIRECATVHRGTASKGQTVVGSDCLIMAYSHVAHDCLLHDHIIMSNATQLAGEVVVEDYAILGGGTLVHQFSHIGQHVMVQGGTRINKDVPPFVIAARDPVQYCGINSVGLARRGFSREQVSAIQDIYRMIYSPLYNISQAVEHVLAELPDSEERALIVEFIQSSPRGIIRGSL
ncbi:MAG: acyl-ACP--UDP-N-acetylglucosamine O-acyltransferase [Paludibacteraceae bacterium]|nr:acyl-ACP--UDP-N-acetylglucosamine O-acyltransferase [Paludibacteraceae bacterium]